MSALVDGAHVDAEPVGSEGGSAARRVTSVIVATRGADCHVRSHCRHCQVCQGDASAGTGMPFQTLGKSPYAKADWDASACGKGDGLRNLDKWRRMGREKRSIQGQGCYRGQGGDHVREHRGGHRAP